jgi:hypothetical protein
MGRIRGRRTRAIRGRRSGDPNRNPLAFADGIAHPDDDGDGHDRDGHRADRLDHGDRLGHGDRFRHGAVGDADRDGLAADRDRDADRADRNRDRHRDGNAANAAQDHLPAVHSHNRALT